jgi:DNA-binding response OmpR family regulator
VTCDSLSSQGGSIYGEAYVITVVYIHIKEYRNLRQNNIWTFSAIKTVWGIVFSFHLKNLN